MSTINVSNLILTLQQKIDSSTNERDLLYYSKAIQQLKTGKIFAVETVSQLPNAQENVGYLYYVKQDEVVYFASSEGWALINKNPMPLFVWGRNFSGMLGDGSTVNKCSPVREFCSAADWCQVSAGFCNMAAIKTSGQLWSWGENNCGALGIGNLTDYCSPIREFCSATNWCQVSTGLLHTSAVKTSGEIWSWGSGQCCALGTSGAWTCSPVREISSSTDWCQVSAGSNRQVAAIKTSGQLWAWGGNTCGVLGDGTTSNRSSPIREISSSTDWCHVTIGLRSAAAVKTTGQLWAWGNCLPDGTTVVKCSPVREFCSATNWCQVSAGNDVSAAIKTDGTLWAWGAGPSLGQGNNTSRCSPVREFCSATNWCQVSVGTHTLAVKTTGELWGWGANNYGNLGVGFTQFAVFVCSSCSPVREITSALDWSQAAAGSNHSSAVLKSISA